MGAVLVPGGTTVVTFEVVRVEPVNHVMAEIDGDQVTTVTDGRVRLAALCADLLDDTFVGRTDLLVGEPPVTASGVPWPSM